MAIAKKLNSWLDDRFNLTPLVEYMRHKYVPIHRHSVWYYMGGVSLFFFIIQVFTGILLLLYYQPGVDSGYESVRFIMTEVHFGWLIRSIHSWSANLFIFFIFIHMFSTFFTHAYRKPRELTWVTGFLLLLLAMGFGFSGYLLPWNELSC
jgi:cytochrome b6